MQKEYKLSRAHYIKESRKWLSVLNELRTENVRLKEQLSDVISGEVSLGLVEEAEQFQQRFVEKDQVIDLLRHDINMLYKQEHMTSKEERQYIVLEKDMEQLIYEFHQMRASFASFLNIGKTG